MERIALHITEDHGIHRPEEPVCLGIPLARGALSELSSLSLLHEQTGARVPHNARTTARWPDGSIRWLALDFPAHVEASGRADYWLAISEPPSASSPLTLEKKHTETGDHYLINTGNGRFRVGTDQFAWYKIDSTDTPLAASTVQISDETGARCQTELTDHWKVTEQGPYKLTLVANGHAMAQDCKPLANLTLRLSFFANSDHVLGELCIHNPRRAKHPGGLWDLGDPGSIHFRALVVRTEVSKPQRGAIRLSSQEEPVLEAEPPLSLRLYQDSSGGEHWNSRNHINAQGELIPQFRGYRLWQNDELKVEGNRPQPLAALTCESGTVQASLPLFWQNFPSALSIEDASISIDLFPEDAAEPYELQGGERKTQRFHLDYGNGQNALAWTHEPLIPALDAIQYERAQAFPWFKADAPETDLDTLIQSSIEGPDNFFAKREVIDEFGWRNFGDLFADHETLYQNESEAPFISHYNNQYDAIYGFARQFALTGDKRWYRLMDDLARHVADIDVYHTEEDRAEYNHGLFWHTDHYLDAHTATHRTFTRHNDTSSTPGQTGGGPAAEHCYTSGLLSHHFITGNLASAEVTEQLANWITTSHEGSGGLLEQLLALKKQELPKLKVLLRGGKVLPYRYPFTRGTGNYLNALLDAYVLTGKQAWLAQAETVIEGTLHPDDDLNARNLLNIETGWSYLVLLTSVAKYLTLKKQHEDTDSHYEFTRRAFFHYATWMRQDERPFLSDPAQLEFPNDTWAAQDLRKAVLMFLAAQFTNEPEHFNRCATDWLDYVTTRLRESPESGFTRVQVILLQNCGPHTLPLPTGLAVRAPVTLKSADKKVSKTPRLSLPELLVRIARRFVRGIVTFRPARERAWLQARVERQ